MIMSLLAWVVLGLIAGFLAGLVMKGSGYGIVGDVVVGILGAVLGGWISANVLGINFTNNPFDLSNILVAFLGAVLLIALLRAFTGRRARV